MGKSGTFSCTRNIYLTTELGVSIGKSRDQSESKSNTEIASKLSNCLSVKLDSTKMKRFSLLKCYF